MILKYLIWSGTPCTVVLPVVWLMGSWLVINWGREMLRCSYLEIFEKALSFHGFYWSISFWNKGVFLHQGGFCSEIFSRSGTLQCTVDNMSFIYRKDNLATASILSHKCHLSELINCIFQSTSTAEQISFCGDLICPWLAVFWWLNLWFSYMPYKFLTFKLCFENNLMGRHL